MLFITLFARFLRIFLSTCSDEQVESCKNDVFCVHRNKAMQNVNDLQWCKFNDPLMKGDYKSGKNCDALLS